VIGLLKNFRDKKVLFFTVLAAGALLMLLGRFFTIPEGDTEDISLPLVHQPSPPPADLGNIRATEERLEEFFALVEGAGAVRVMVGFSSHRETVFAVDTNFSESFTREEDSQGGHRETTQTANQQQTVLIPDRNGASRPLVLRESEPTIAGIVIIAEGGDNPVIRAELTRAAQAVLGLDAHRIQILTMRSN
jgi:stage III sporulation protein AG